MTTDKYITSSNSVDSAEESLSIVVPVYDEAEAIPLFLEEIQTVLKTLPFDYEIIFAIDPSSDGTEEIVANACETDTRIKALIFSRRVGQPSATLAGLEWASGNAVIVMDVDLQDPPNILPSLLEKWQSGYDVVLPQRRQREGDTWLKRCIVRVGYQLIERISDFKIPPNTGDFRLMSRRVVDSVVALRESHGFLRGLTAIVGFKQTTIQFDRPIRRVGRGKYSRFTGSLRIGVNGIVGFSSIPLTMAMVLGFATAGLAFVLGLTIVVMKVAGFPFPIAFSTIATLMLFLGGVQLICVGILGEYIGRIYDEVKARPRYILEREIGFANHR
jgi:dolichol-phosphate mannosyltransferase